MSVDRSTLLRLIRGPPDPPVGSGAVLGVDEFALRRGHQSGTVLVDLGGQAAQWAHVSVQGLVAAGAVGGYALELARSRGLQVTRLARPGDEEFVTGTGASFTSTIPSEPGFDLVLDAAGAGRAGPRGAVDAGHYVGVIPIAIPPVRSGHHHPGRVGNTRR